MRYAGQQWAPVAGTADDADAGQVCATGVRAFGPLAVGYANAVPTFGDRTVGALALRVNEAQAVELPAAMGGDGMIRYTLEPADLPARLSYVAPPDPTATGGMLAGTPTAETAARAYTLTATDVDGDAATLAFTLDVVRIPEQVTVTAASAVEGRPVEFTVTLSRAVAAPLTLHWTAGTLAVPTLNDRRVEPTETFTVTVTLPVETWVDLTQATVGGQAVALERGLQRGRWRHAEGVAYGVARALGVEVGAPLAGGDGQFGQVRGAA